MAIITFWIIFIICSFIAVLMYLVVRGADICKTDRERFDEDEEQSRIVSEKYNNGGKVKWIDYQVF